MNADRCDIYTDVDGVYTTDPRIAPKARKLDRITFEEMLEMASSGAKVLQTRSVAMAMRYNVNLQVRSSITAALGTLVVNEDSIMEQETIIQQQQRFIQIFRFLQQTKIFVMMLKKFLIF